MFFFAFFFPFLLPNNNFGHDAWKFASSCAPSYLHYLYDTSAQLPGVIPDFFCIDADWLLASMWGVYFFPETVVRCCYPALFGCIVLTPKPTELLRYYRCAAFFRRN